MYSEWVIAKHFPTMKDSRLTANNSDTGLCWMQRFLQGQRFSQCPNDPDRSGTLSLFVLRILRADDVDVALSSNTLYKGQRVSKLRWVAINNSA